MRMQSVISEAILTVAVVVLAGFLVTSFSTSIGDALYAFKLTYSSTADRVTTSVKVLLVVNSSASELKLWVKNTGLRAFPNSLIVKSDIFIGFPNGTVILTQYGVESYLSWSYFIVNDVDNDSYWDPGETLEVKVRCGSLPTGNYWVQFVTHNGVSVTTDFSIGGG